MGTQRNGFAQEVIEECAAFPYGDHDDMVDSMTQALMRFRQGGLINHPEDYIDEPVEPETEDVLLMDEFETYEDVIDANSGVGVEAGESLTDYIKRNNIKIKEVDMDPIGDFEKILKEANLWKKKASNQYNLHQATWILESKKLSKKNLLRQKVEDQDL